MLTVLHAYQALVKSFKNHKSDSQCLLSVLTQKGRPRQISNMKAWKAFHPASSSLEVSGIECTLLSPTLEVSTSAVLSAQTSIVLLILFRFLPVVSLIQLRLHFYSLKSTVL